MVPAKRSPLVEALQAPHVVGGFTGVLTGDCLPTPALDLCNWPPYAIVLTGTSNSVFRSLRLTSLPPGRVSDKVWGAILPPAVFAKEALRGPVFDAMATGGLLFFFRCAVSKP